MRPLLIGQAPGPNTDPRLPLFPVPKTSAGGKLQQLTGLTRGEYLTYFERVNLLYNFPGTHAREDKFPMRFAKVSANSMRPLLAHRTVVLVGRNVASAFGLGWIRFHTWEQIRCCRRIPRTEYDGLSTIAVVPHTSGRSHWYNTLENRREAEQFWNDFLKNHRKVLPFVAAERM